MVRYLVAIAMLAGLAHADVYPFAKRQFNHQAHIGKIKGVPCARCHQTSDALGTLRVDIGKQSRAVDHEGCSGSGCHGDMKYLDCKRLDSGTPQHAELPACQTCHSSEIQRCLNKQVPADDKPAGFAHGLHVAQPDIDRTCSTCHDASEPRIAKVELSPAAHGACATCHQQGKAAAKKPMSACDGCHLAFATPSTNPKNDPFQIAFAHAKHATASSAPTAKCTSCHGVANAANADAPIRATMMPKFDPMHARATPPTTGTCASCHDGKRTWSVVGTKCTTCHTQQTPMAKVLRREPAFSHAEHEKHGANMTECSSCHTLDKQGRIVTPGGDAAHAELAAKDLHAGCAVAGCHAARDFASRQPTICAVCHESATPWSRTAARLRTPPAPDKFQNINHRDHLKNPNIGCDNCHGKTFTEKARPHGHQYCADCHANGQSPAITACKSCHSGNVPERASSSTWSVAATFEHAKHQQDANGKTPKCASCHTNVTTATSLAGIKAPAMLSDAKQGVAGCDRCHDGKTTIAGKVVFKATGTGCVKCHAKKRDQVSVAP